jgi:hypothetical protein
MVTLKNKWGELLEKNIVTYASSRAKRAMFIEDYLKSKSLFLQEIRCLEQGAFSAKDSLYLKIKFPQWTFTATDKDIDVVRHITEAGIEGLQEDAFDLSFKDNKFDLTFQSGLIINFNDQQAFNIIKEQYRVTSKISFVFAHNSANYIDRFCSFFKLKVMRNNIYNYRTYDVQTIKLMALSLGCEYEIFYYDNMILNFVNRHFTSLSPLIRKLGISKFRCFANELVLVLHK